MLDKLIKALLRYKLRNNPLWMATSFGIDENTDIHVIVETWRNGKHLFGAREEGGANA